MKKQLECKLQGVDAIVKHNRPIKYFEWTNELDNAKGLNNGQNYNSCFAAVSFLDSIAQSVLDEMTDIVKDVHFVSLSSSSNKPQRKMKFYSNPIWEPEK